MFSYAQAAKGLAPSTQTNSTVASSTSSEHGGKENVAPAETSTSPAKPNQISEQLDEQSNSKASPAQESSNAGNSHKDQDESSSKIQSKSQNENVLQSAEATEPASSDHAVHTTEPVQTDSLLPGAGPKSSENQINVAASEKSIQSVDNEKGKETDDDWEKVSVPSIAPEKELKAAPLPPVNIWLQRKEAQEAKIKELGTQRPAPVSQPPKQKSSASHDEPRRRPNNRDATAEKDTNGAPRRVNSGGRAAVDRKEQTPTQASPRSPSLQGEKVTSFPPPSPADTESWPTPDTTAVDDRRRSATFDKSDKVDAKANSQKKWIQMPFVPTAKFETQLPPAANARRGGRASNRGRDAAGRGGSNAQNSQHGEKPEAGSMGPPPLPNKSGDQDRGRNNNSSKNPRASSVPTQGSQAVSSDRATNSFSRAPPTNSKEQVDNNATATITGVEEATVAEQASHNSSRNAAAKQESNTKPDSEQKDVVQPASNRASTATDGGHRGGHQGDRYRAPQEGIRSPVEYVDRSLPQGREWSRGRTDPTREKNEPWRERREPRSERGRGGYRGRGNHSGYNGHAGPHNYTPSMSQNGFESSKPLSNNEARNRQASQPFPQAQPMSNNRSNPRSQSIPVAMVQQGYYAPAQGYPQPLSPSEVNFGNYPPQMHGGIMNAMPYNDQLASMALISMVVTQLEYYFSIDNLCKDMFLRRHMDSQGFVPFSVVAGFKRIQTLTDGQISHEGLRNICQQVRNVEVVTADDGEDRLRSRENWQDFVLPMGERIPAAQNDGPTLRAQNIYPTHHTSMEFTPTNGPIRSPQAGLNGFAEPFSHAIPPVGYPFAPYDGTSVEYGAPHPEPQLNGQSRRASNTSPFSKIQSPKGQEKARSPSGHMMNGHHRTTSTAEVDENVFPDEKIPELKVVVRDPTVDADTSLEKVAALRGGAGSPEQLERFRSLQPNQSAVSPSALDTEQPPYWTKDGEIAQIPIGPGFVHEDYLALHDKAIAQRLENHLDGALAVLYSFWSSFLVGNFNVSMYQEFTSLAAEDFQSGSEMGRSSLLQYYDTILTSKKPMSERIANDIVTLARQEDGARRPMFQKLRSAWRNGATNLKTRKRLGNVLSTEEKTEFDKSV